MIAWILQKGRILASEDWWVCGALTLRTGRELQLDKFADVLLVMFLISSPLRPC